MRRRNFIEEMKTVFLTDGKKIVLDDDDDLILSLVSNNETVDTYKVSCPSGGYGGGSLWLSPSEKYLVFSYFSGESEEAFSVFEIENGRLKLLYDSGYLYGENAHYSFANDERILIQTFRTGFWCKENAKTDENMDTYYEFGELNLFDLETDEFSRHTIHVYPSDDWIEEVTDAGSPMFSEINNGKFSVTVPWGKVIFREPLDDILVVKLK